jgi:hypothetical protein
MMKIQTASSSGTFSGMCHTPDASDAEYSACAVPSTTRSPTAKVAAASGPTCTARPTVEWPFEREREHASARERESASARGWAGGAAGGC